MGRLTIGFYLITQLSSATINYSNSCLFCWVYPTTGQ